MERQLIVVRTTESDPLSGVCLSCAEEWSRHDVGDAVGPHLDKYNDHVVEVRREVREVLVSGTAMWMSSVKPSERRAAGGDES